MATAPAPARARCAEPDAEPDTVREVVSKLIGKLDERSMEKLAAGLIQLQVEEEASSSARPGARPEPPPSSPGGVGAGLPELAEDWAGSSPPTPLPGGVGARLRPAEACAQAPEARAPVVPVGRASLRQTPRAWPGPSPPPPLGAEPAEARAPVPIGQASLQQMLQAASEAQAAARARQAAVEARAAAEVRAAVWGAVAAVGRARAEAARAVFEARAAHEEQGAKVAHLQRALRASHAGQPAQVAHLQRALRASHAGQPAQELGEVAGERPDGRATAGVDDACATSIVIRDMRPSWSQRGVMQRWLDEQGYCGKYDVLLVFADSGASRAHAVVNFTVPVLARLFVHEMSGLLNVSYFIVQGSRALREHFAFAGSLAEAVSEAPPGCSLGA